MDSELLLRGASKKNLKQVSKSAAERASWIRCGGSAPMGDSVPIAVVSCRKEVVSGEKKTRSGKKEGSGFPRWRCTESASLQLSAR